jgi:hypothetical protein
MPNKWNGIGINNGFGDRIVFCRLYQEEREFCGTGTKYSF